MIRRTLARLVEPLVRHEPASQPSPGPAAPQHEQQPVRAPRRSTRRAPTTRERDPVQDVIAKAIGTRLVELREAAGWSMRELGRRSGTRVTQVSRHEHGLVSPPLYVLARYARAYGISVAAIVHAADLELAKRREEGELQ